MASRLHWGAGVAAPATQAVRNDRGRVPVGLGVGGVPPATQAVRNDRGRVLVGWTKKIKKKKPILFFKT